MKSRHFLTFAFILMYLVQAQSQGLGNAQIINHAKNDFGGGTQSYELTQNANGYVFAANNDGLLMFNGAEWSCFKQPNRSILRSIEVDNAKIYAGGQNELGYFTPETNNELKYVSLLDNLPDSISNIEEVWDIDHYNGKLIVRCSHHLLQIENDSISLLLENPGLSSSFMLEDSYFYQVGDSIYELGSNAFVFQTPPQDRCVGLFQSEVDTLMILASNGLSSSTGQLEPSMEVLDELLSNSGVNTVQSTSKGYAFATRRGGLILTNHLLIPQRQYTVNEGLQRNDVIAVFEDRHHDLWVGMSNGIDYIEESSPFKYSHPDSFLLGAGHAVVSYKDELYFGTSNGLFKAIPQLDGQTNYELIEGTLGQVYGLNVIGDNLWIGHQEGALVYNGAKAQKIENSYGVWTHFSIPNDKTHVLAGHYNGLYLFSKQQDKWVLEKQLEGFGESSRIGSYSGDYTWWISHPYKGAWKITLDPTSLDIVSSDFYGKNKGFPSDLGIYVSKVNNQTMFTSEEGIYTYDSLRDSIRPMDSWDTNTDQHYLRVFGNEFNTIWAVTDQRVEFIEIIESPVSKSIEVHPISRLKEDLVAGFELMYSYDENHVIAGTESGFAHIHLPTLLLSLDESPRLLVSSVEDLSQNDSTVYSALNDVRENGTLTLDKRSTSLRFNFTCTSFHDVKELDYEVYLEGLETAWTSSEKSFSKEYTNLEPGSYTFHLRAVDHSGNIRHEIEFPIIIEAPWHQTRLALIIAITIGLISLTLMVLVPRRKFEREKNQLVQQKEQELTVQKEESVQAIDELKSQRLQDELSYKNKELASATMHLVQKGQILQSVRDSLKQLDLSALEKSETQIRRIVKVINEDIRLDNNWEQFERHFDQVHVDFLKRLRKTYPNLTANDHKLCAYLRMTLSTKEIATIMNISVRGVEISRYRLRKKLQLEAEVKLSEFIQNI
ncbi:MAG: triple tyrosine motif-containing protein [Flavobacteriales bacterium]|nr:triple tyrosine motif-containing protein [Flavobacteriales bacterium]